MAARGRHDCGCTVDFVDGYRSQNRCNEAITYLHTNCVICRHRVCLSARSCSGQVTRRITTIYFMVSGSFVSFFVYRSSFFQN